MKTIWIVDGSYLFKSAPGKLDYNKYKNELETINTEPFFESYYLDSTPNPPSDSQDKFHTWLKCAPPDGPHMRVQLYKLKNLNVNCPHCKKKFSIQVQKGVDVGVATVALKLATQNKYERLVLSAGDGDFEDAINYIKSELHKEIWISGFKGSVSADLQSYANQVIWIDSFWKKIEKP